jgi:cell division protein FtsA
MLPRRKLSELIEPRAEEIFSLVKDQCEELSLLGKLGSGIVLTGGSAIMDGMTELADRVFHLPVRRGVPRQISGLVDALNGPMYATGVGLALRELRPTSLNGVGRSREGGHGWQRMRHRVVEWFRDFF